MNSNWWKAAGIRCLKTVCQTAIATIGSAAVLESVNWWVVLSASVLAGILSLLTSIAGLPEVQPDTRDGIELKDEDVSEKQEEKGEEIAARYDDYGELKGGEKHE